MTLRFRFLLLVAVACVVFPERSPAPVVFRPGEKVKYNTPGEEEINGNAEQLFAAAQSAERDGNRSRAIKIYRKLVKKYPHSSLASGSLFRVAKLTEDAGDVLKAARLYRSLMEYYPQTDHFVEAIEAQFRIGELYVNGKKIKFLGVPLATSMDDAVQIFAAIVRSAPDSSTSPSRARSLIPRNTDHRQCCASQTAATAAVSMSTASTPREDQRAYCSPSGL